MARALLIVLPCTNTVAVKYKAYKIKAWKRILVFSTKAVMKRFLYCEEEIQHSGIRFLSTS
jgi:hypothetical protein